MEIIVDGAALVLATFYAVQCVCYEDGAFDMFKRFRAFIGINEINVILVDGEERHVTGDVDRSSDDYLYSIRQVNDGLLAKIFSCHRCTAPYVAAVLFLIFLVLPEFIYILGMAGGAMYLLEKFNV